MIPQHSRRAAVLHSDFRLSRAVDHRKLAKFAVLLLLRRIGTEVESHPTASVNSPSISPPTAQR